jgi:hypothetical protein
MWGREGGGVKALLRFFSFDGVSHLELLIYIRDVVHIFRVIVLLICY